MTNQYGSQQGDDFFRMLGQPKPVMYPNSPMMQAPGLQFPRQEPDQQQTTWEQKKANWGIGSKPTATMGAAVEPSVASGGADSSVLSGSVAPEAGGLRAILGA